MVTIRDILVTGRGLEMEFQPSDRVISTMVEERGVWEEEVAKAIEKFIQPGWTFLDVGANVGYFSLIAAQRGHDVIAIEADREACDILGRNAIRNGLGDRIKVIWGAASGAYGSGFLATDREDNPGSRYLAGSGTPITTETLTALLGDARPEFIKIDIEGKEFEALKVSPEILEAAQVIVFEAGGHATRYGVEPLAVVDLLKDAGFTVTYMNGNELDDQWTDAVENVPNAYINLLARRNAEPAVRGTILLCAWRGMTVETAQSLMQMRDLGWGYGVVHGDALIARSRSRAVSNWYRFNPDEDVFLMIDDDIVFTPEHAEKVFKLARDTRSVACAAYVVKDGSHTACRRFPGQDILFGPESPPVEIEYPATGFMAVHRDVLDAMVAMKRRDMPEWREAARAAEAMPGGAERDALINRLEEPAMPLVDEYGKQPFYPFFDTFVQTWNEGQENERHEYLSEDYAFGEMARRAGFKVWLDPSVTLFHLGTFPYNVHQMKDVQRVDGPNG